MTTLPSGTVTFLFTDVEGSTRLWQADPSAMRLAIERHLNLLEEAVSARGGVHFKTVGDAIQAAFPTADTALAATVAAQQSLVVADWEVVGGLSVRMALHSGAATPVAGDYLAPSLNLLSRLLAIGHGGQILMSETTRRLLESDVPGVTLRDLGEHRLRDVLEPERIWQVLAPGLPDQFPPLTSLAAHPHNLRAPATPLIGRENEVETVSQALAQGARLVTLTGAGGSGKTRLAQHIAAELLETFGDGVWFLDLAALADPALLLPSIAATLGVREREGQSQEDRLIAYLAGKRILLVLDNLEQFSPFREAARVIAGLLTSVPALTIMATSRTPLQLHLEREIPIAPLPLPDPQGTIESIGASPAVQLFVARARAARPGFALTAQNAPIIALLCRRLDGLPLALELVASRARALSPEDLLARLERTLDLAADRTADRPDRHRTLEATVAWSHDLLGREEQAAFRRLAVFVGGGTLEAVENVLAAFAEPPLDADASLETLIEHALLLAEEQPDGSLRYRMLETVRAAAGERLRRSGEEAAARRAHADFFRAIVPVAPAAMWSARDMHNQLDRLEIEHENLRAALAWLLATNSQDLLELVNNLMQFWWERGYMREARSWLDQALAHAHGPPTIARVRALLRLGHFVSSQGDPEQAQGLAEESLRLARLLGSREDEAATLGALGSFCFDRGDLDGAEAYLRDSRDVYHDLGHQEGIAWACWRLSWLAEARGDAAEMDVQAGTVLRIARDLGQPGAIAGALQQLGRAAKLRGDLENAEAFLTQALSLIEPIGMLGPIAEASELLGDIAREQAQFDRARVLFARSRAIYEQIGWPGAEAMLMYRLAMLAADTDDLREAADYCARALTAIDEQNRPWDQATALIGAGWIGWIQGQPATAATRYQKGLALFQTIGNVVGEAAAVHAIGTLALHLGRAVEGARLIGAATAQRKARGTRQLPSEHRREVQAIDVTRAALGEPVLTSILAEGGALTWDAAVAGAHALAREVAAAGPQRPPLCDARGDA